MDKPSHWVTFLNYSFNSMAGFVHNIYFTQNWVKSTQHFLECVSKFLFLGELFP